MVPSCGIEDLLRHPRIRRENADGLRRIQRGTSADPEHELRSRFMGKAASFLARGKGRVRFDPGKMGKGDSL